MEVKIWTEPNGPNYTNTLAKCGDVEFFAFPHQPMYGRKDNTAAIVSRALGTDKGFSYRILKCLPDGRDETLRFAICETQEGAIRAASIWIDKTERGESLLTQNDCSRGACSHREYYGQVCEMAGIKLAKDHPMVRKTKLGDDPHYNHVPLKEWDTFGAGYAGRIDKALKKCGWGATQAGIVCTMKEAVRRAIESEE